MKVTIVSDYRTASRPALHLYWLHIQGVNCYFFMFFLHAHHFRKESFFFFFKCLHNVCILLLAPGFAPSLLWIYTKSTACINHKDTIVKTHQVICVCETIREVLGFEMGFQSSFLNFDLFLPYDNIEHS